MLGKIIGFTLLAVCIHPVYSQIKGTLVDSETAYPIFGAHIVSDKESTITDENGAFFLQQKALQIIISHVGYTTDTLFENALQNNVTVALKRNIQAIEPITIRGNLNTFSMMKMPSGVGYISNKDGRELDRLLFVESLNKIPGVYAQSGTLNTNRISIRGIGSRTPYGTNRIKAYYGDIPLSSGDGTTEIEDLNASDIGSVEVLKGSKSALYGSGLGGAIVLNKPVYSDGFHASAKADIAEYQTLKAETALNFKHKGFYLAGNASKMQSSGWRQNSGYNRINLTCNTGYTRNKSHLDILFLLIQTKAYIPSSINKQMFLNSPDSAAPNWLSVNGHERYSKIIAGLSYQHPLSNSILNKISLFAQSYNGFELRPFNVLDDKSGKLGLRDILTWKNKSLKLQAGFEALFERYSWDIYETMNGKQGNLVSRYAEKRRPLSIFLNGQYQFQNQILLETGLSVNTLFYALTDYTKASTDLSGNYTYNWIYSPFIGMSLPFSQWFVLYSSLSHGFSAPSVEETLLPEGNINPNLKPETGLHAEIGIRMKSKNEQLFSDITVFGIWVNNLLVTKRQTEAVFYGANAGKTMHRGIEFTSVMQCIKKNRPVPVLLQLNYSAINALFIDYVDDGVNYSRNTLPGIPEQYLHFSAQIESPWGLYLSPSYQYTGAQYLDDLNSQSLKSFHLFAVKTGYMKTTQRGTLNFVLQIKNVFNQRYASMVLVNAPSFSGSLPRYFYPGMPRNYSLSVNYSF